jgi:GPH family glycoside/pentoside/hexuronide:cation symporter
MTKQEQARLWPLLAYSGPMIAMSIVNLLLIAYVPNFYAAEIGISIATVGAIFMAARAFDAVIDPIIGNWSDRTRGKWGRRKPWIAFGVPAFMVMTWAFFQPPADVGMTYLMVAALLFYVTYAIVIIPYMSWGAEIRRDYEGRTQINSLREAGGILGTILATLLPVLVLPLFVEGDPTLRQILALLALTIIVVLAITVPIALRSAPQGEFEPHPPLGLFAALGLLRKNKPLLRMLVAIFVVWLGGAFHNSTILFYVTEGLGLGRADFLWLILAQYLMALISLPAWTAPGSGVGRNGLLSGAPGLSLRAPGRVCRSHCSLHYGWLHDPGDLGDAARDHRRHGRLRDAQRRQRRFRVVPRALCFRTKDGAGNRGRSGTDAGRKSWLRPAGAGDPARS